MITLVLILISLVSAVAMAVTVRAVLTAEAGFEDERGFHRGHLVALPRHPNHVIPDRRVRPVAAQGPLALQQLDQRDPSDGSGCLA